MTMRGLHLHLRRAPLRWSAVLLVAAGIAASGSAAAGELHRWTDSEGHLHISDAPPPGGAKQTASPSATSPSSRLSPAPPPLHRSQADAFTRGLLWRVEPARAGAAAAPSYVFGTMHSADPRITQLAPEVENAFVSAKAVCAEASLDGTALMTVGQRMFASEGKTLDSVLGQQLFDRVAPLMEQRGFPSGFLPMLKPWVVLLTLSIPTAVSSQAGTILDADLVQRAEAAGKEVCGLETLDEQVDSVEKIPERDQVAHIRAAADAAPTLDQTYAKAVELYLRGDLAGLGSLEAEGGSAEAKRLDADLSRRLVDQRNVRMAERIAPRASRGGVFVAIGAAHLGGAGGVLALLERRGFSVSRVEPAPTN